MQLAVDSASLLLTARREEKLLALQSEIEPLGGSAVVSAGDIASPEFRQSLLAVAKSELGGLDILINNAGIGGIGTFASADEDRLRRIMEVNFFAPAELVRTALPMLRDSDDGVIVNIGSVLGHCPVPKKSEYCASKFALHGWTDALRMELQHDGIDVLLVSPSTTSSAFFDNAMRSEGKTAKNSMAMTPEAVANRIIAAIRSGRREVILSLGGKLIVWADRLAPGVTGWLLGRYA